MYVKNITIHTAKDWSKVSDQDIWAKIGFKDPERNFGLHYYKNDLWTGGYVGVGRLFDNRDKPLIIDGKVQVALVESRFNVDLWNMLSTVLRDNEFDKYCDELERNNKSLFRVFYDEPLLKLNVDTLCDREILYVLSFVFSAYNLCKKGLKKNMQYRSENFCCKIRGKINIIQNIKLNTCKGRNDRFACKYIIFNENNIENKILKFAIIKCKNILKRKRFFSFDVEKKLLFITKALLNVDLYKPDTKDFNTIQASGLYSHYKPVLNQAKTIIEQKFFSIIQNNESAKKREFCLLPYIINAEALFEFYARAIIKLALKDTDFYVENYSERLFLQDRISKKGESEENIHLMEYCVPDIIIKRKADNRVIMVLDAKYKNSFISNRDDTHQLLSYVLLTGAQKCGFIFPNSANPGNTEIKSFGEKKDYLTLRPGNIFYNEILLGNNVKNLDSIILEILNKA